MRPPPREKGSGLGPEEGGLVTYIESDKQSASDGML